VKLACLEIVAESVGKWEAAVVQVEVKKMKYQHRGRAFEHPLRPHIRL
jgi:hypothetical protein